MIAQPQLASLASLGIALLAAWGLYPDQKLSNSATPPQGARFASPSAPPDPRTNSAPQGPAATAVSSSPAPRSSAPTTATKTVEKSTTGRETSPPNPKLSPGSATAQRGVAKIITPSQAFTMAEAGEKPADVAERVYGDRAAEADLIRANRDQFLEAGKPFAKRTILRTPARDK